MTHTLGGIFLTTFVILVIAVVLMVDMVQR